METLADDELDALARAFHDLYRRSSPDGVVGGTAWEDLGPEDRAANRASAGAVLGQAADMGYDVVRVTGTPEPVDLPASVVERASIREHDRWAAVKRAQGWSYGPERDHARRTHPDLVPWDELDEPAREKDRVRMRVIPELLAGLGLALVARGDVA
ncbi:MAG: hypothetical protein KDB35_03270 [Acidimicrobiales bacterium]|nr:hypothetical protein [Acidimicrobiales bacterium]MCB1015988.1 hypothetical protein [Acidimicrobiales bacterium]